MASLYKKPVIVRDPKTGEKVKTKSKKWWGRYTDSLGCEKRVPLATEKMVAQTSRPKRCKPWPATATSA